MGLTEHLTGVEEGKYAALLSTLLWQPLPARELQKIFKTSTAVKEKKLKTLHIAGKLSVTLNKLLDLGLVERIDKAEIKDVVAGGMVKKRYYTGRWRFNFGFLTALVKKTFEGNQIDPVNVIDLLRGIFDNTGKGNFDVYPKHLAVNCGELLKIIGNELKSAALFFDILARFTRPASADKSFLGFEKLFLKKGGGWADFVKKREKMIKRRKQELAALIKTLKDTAPHIIKSEKLPKELLELVDVASAKLEEAITYKGKRRPFSFGILNQFIMDICLALDAELGYKPFPVKIPSIMYERQDFFDAINAYTSVVKQ